MKKIAITLMALLSSIALCAKPATTNTSATTAQTESTKKDHSTHLFNFVQEHAAELGMHVKRLATATSKKGSQQKKSPKKTQKSGPSREELAFETVKEAAQDGYVPAQDLLAYCYATGTGTKPSGKLAFSWYLSAALAGSNSAKESLIACFEEGIGVTKDTTMAQVLRALLMPPTNN